MRLKLTFIGALTAAALGATLLVGGASATWFASSRAVDSP